MARIELLSDQALSPEKAQQVRQLEAAGVDASVLRAQGHRQEMFDQYNAFYYPAHQGGLVEPALKELVRLKIARLNDCFT